MPSTGLDIRKTIEATVTQAGLFTPISAERPLTPESLFLIEEMAAEGDRAARIVVKQLDDISEYLSACQFGITLASLGIGFLGEPAIADLVEPALGGLSHAVAVPISIAIALVLADFAALGYAGPFIEIALGGAISSGTGGGGAYPASGANGLAGDAGQVGGRRGRRSSPRRRSRPGCAGCRRWSC